MVFLFELHKDEEDSPFQFGNSPEVHCEPVQFHAETIEVKYALTFFHLPGDNIS